LGLLWEWLPEGALDHDPNAYAESERNNTTDGLRQNPIRITSAE
jgi:hypothetical protein